MGRRNCRISQNVNVSIVVQVSGNRGKECSAPEEHRPKTVTSLPPWSIVGKTQMFIKALFCRLLTKTLTLPSFLYKVKRDSPNHDTTDQLKQSNGHGLGQIEIVFCDAVPFLSNTGRQTNLLQSPADCCLWSWKRLPHSSCTPARQCSLPGLNWDNSIFINLETGWKLISKR